MINDTKVKYMTIVFCLKANPGRPHCRELWPYGYGWDSGSEGLGLESHHRMGKIVVLTGKEENILKRGPGWPIF